MILLSEEECRKGVGLPFDIQQKLRSGDFAFISEMGRHIQLDERVMCTANYMVTLFFIRRSYLNYDRNLISTAALMLAGKIHNFKRQNKRVYAREYAMVYHNITNKRQHNSQITLDDGTKAEYLAKLFKSEYKILKTLEFDLDIDLPIFYLQRTIQSLYLGISNEQRDVLHSMARVMANESMRSIAPLCIPTLAVAVGSVVLGSVICGLPPPNELLAVPQPNWWTVVDPSLKLEDINLAMSLVLEAINMK